MWSWALRVTSWVWLVLTFLGAVVLLVLVPGANGAEPDVGYGLASLFYSVLGFPWAQLLTASAHLTSGYAELGVLVAAAALNTAILAGASVALRRSGR